MPKKISGQKSYSTPKVFDVFKPGKSLASPTSRPVIAGHRPMVRDSMFTDKPGRSVPNARDDRESFVSPDKTTVSSPVDESSSESSAQPILPDEQPTTPTKIPAEPSSSTLPSEPEMTGENGAEAEPPASTDEPASAPAEPATPDQYAPQTEPLESSATSAPIADVAQVVVSNHKPVRSHSMDRALLVILLVIALAIIAIDGVLDGGIWTPDFNIPHTHLLKH